MKTILKIAALAAITALAVISCGPPELPQAHNEYWDNYNDKFDATKYTDNTASTSNYPSVSFNLNAYGEGFTGVKEDNTVTVSFPKTADVLKKDALTTADLKFISLYTYSADAAKTAADTATATAPNNTPTSLTELTGWSFDRREDTTIYLKLSAISVNSSKIVFKLDSSAYTYSNGLKLDKDGNGVSGEKDYDDFYKVMDVTGITNKTNPVLRGNRGWTVTLAGVPSGSGTTETKAAANYKIATTSFTSGSNTLTDSDYDNILKTLAPGFKLETLSNGNWTASSNKGELEDVSPSNIIVKDFSPSHNVPYRVVFEKGSISLETTQSYFGVKQRIKIIGSSGSIYENAKIKKTKLESIPGVYIDITKRDFKDFNDGIYHPVYGRIRNYDRPTEGYWTNGFIVDTNWNYNSSYDENATSGENMHQYYQQGDPSYLPPADDDPNPVYVTDDFEEGSELITDSYGNEYYKLLPPRSQPNTDKDITGWKWNITSSTPDYSFEATDWEEKKGPQISEWYERYVKVTNHSHDGFGGNIVLKIQLNVPVSKPDNAITNNYYFKELDLTTFKNNFKIYSYSLVDHSYEDWVYDGQDWVPIWVNEWVDPGLTGAKDVVEIGIEKVEFKSEGLPSSTTNNQIFGKNVIYITLNPKYRKDLKVKTFFLGEGFGYADGITVFTEGKTWKDKGFVGYTVSGEPVNGLPPRNPNDVIF